MRSNTAFSRLLLTYEQIWAYLHRPMGIARRESISKVTVLLNSTEFERFKAYCQARGFKKSTLIARLIREHLDAEHFAVHGARSPKKGDPNGD